MDRTHIGPNELEIVIKKNLVLPIDSLKSTSVALSKHYRREGERERERERLIPTEKIWGNFREKK